MRGQDHVAQRDFAAALLDPALPCPAGLCVPAGADLARRFDVHRNNVVASLVEALADSFPVVLALVGEDFFRATAAGPTDFVLSGPLIRDSVPVTHTIRTRIDCP